MLNKTILELIKEEVANINDVSADMAIKVSAMGRRACLESEDASVKETLVTYAKSHKEQYVNGSILIGEDKEAANQMYEELLKNVGDIDTNDAVQALNVLPFYIEAETYIGKKEHYQDVTVRFNSAVEALEENFDTTNAITLMLALVSAYELMSEQLFEHYMAVADNYKKLLKEVLPKLECASKEDRMIAAYTIYRAADMKIILKEKYETVADELI